MHLQPPLVSPRPCKCVSLTFQKSLYFDATHPRSPPELAGDPAYLGSAVGTPHPVTAPFLQKQNLKIQNQATGGKRFSKYYMVPIKYEY